MKENSGRTPKPNKTTLKRSRDTLKSLKVAKMIKEIASNLKSEDMDLDDLREALENSLRVLNAFTDLDREDQILIVQGQLNNYGVKNFLEVGELIYTQIFEGIFKSDIATLNKKVGEYCFGIYAALSIK